MREIRTSFNLELVGKRKQKTDDTGKDKSLSYVPPGATRIDEV